MPIVKGCSRKEMLRASAISLVPLALPNAMGASNFPVLTTANGGTETLPWLDKNGSHNQPAGPNLEPSHIYHFKGQVARSSTFTGMGTDNKVNRIAFGTPTTNYGVMRGEYWAARATQHGILTHI